MSTTDFFCPNCKAHLGTRFSISKKIAEIGPSTISCPSCSSQVNTNSKEWIDFTLFDKAKLWFEVYFYYAVLIGPVFAYAAHYFLKEKFAWHDIASIAVSLVFYVAIVLLVHLRHVSQVQASLDRTKLDSSAN
jgi:hypothetical protein